LHKVIEVDTTNKRIRECWVEQVVEWCEALGGITTQHTVGNGEAKGDTDLQEEQTDCITPRKRKNIEMPIKVRLGDRTQYIGTRGNTLEQLKSEVRQYFPELEESLILLTWWMFKDMPWQLIEDEEELSEAIDTMYEQGRPVARLVIPMEAGEKKVIPNC